MQHETQINYKIRRSGRARRIRITINCDGEVTVTQPWGMADQRILDFVAEKSAWIRQKLEFFANWQPSVLSGGRVAFRQNKTEALSVIKERLKHYNQFYNLSYNRIFIRNQKTRWGSCSGNRNLSFNYKLILLPERLRDYVIVHELCHLQEFNHSARFWSLVAQKFPDYKELRIQIRNYKF